MATPLINHQNLINFPLKTHSFPPADAINFSDDIEMIEFDSLNYTSLKDLIPSTSPPASASPTGGSWREIPIKDPLVQHAAWAYLQPMVEAHEDGDRRKCCGLFGCFNDVVSALFSGWFADGRSGGGDEVD